MKNLNELLKIRSKEEKPWSVKFWETDLDRDKGMSNIFGTYSCYDEAFAEGIRAAKLNNWACCEIQIEIDNEMYPVYIYAVTEPEADGFVM